MSAAINGSFNLADVRDLAAGTIAAAKKDAKPQMTTYAVWNLMRNNVFDSSKASRDHALTIMT